MTKSTRVMDVLSAAVSIVIVLIAVVWLWQTGAFQVSLMTQNNLIWYVIRSLGITAYILMTLSVVWGLVLSGRAAKDWSPGMLSMLLHSTISWLSLVFSALHAALLMFDDYFAYHLLDILVPFRGPYRPLAVGLGTLAFWILVIVTPSFALKKRILGHRLWKTIHYGSYAAFVLVTVHGLSAGTDAHNLGFRIMLGTGVFLTIILLGYRLGSRAQDERKTARRSAQSSTTS